MKIISSGVFLFIILFLSFCVLMLWRNERTFTHRTRASGFTWKYAGTSEYEKYRYYARKDSYSEQMCNLSIWSYQQYFPELYALEKKYMKDKYGIDIDK